ncbi:MAG: hypothetical protein U0V56_00155 [Actinomycetota bacterium]
MDRLKRNPGGWGLALGRAIGMVSLFAWIVVSNDAADVSSRVNGFGTITGQTIGLVALLRRSAGSGSPASYGGGRILWALLGLVTAGLLLASGWSPSSRRRRWRSGSRRRSSRTKLQVGAGTANASAADAIKEGFASGALSARFAIGAILGLIGGALGVLGALYGFGKRPEPA